jgi:hypothetical protein
LNLKDVPCRLQLVRNFLLKVGTAGVVASLATPIRNYKIGSAEARKNMLVR